MLYVQCIYYTLCDVLSSSVIVHETGFVARSLWTDFAPHLHICIYLRIACNVGFSGPEVVVVFVCLFLDSTLCASLLFNANYKHQITYSMCDPCHYKFPFRHPSLLKVNQNTTLAQNTRLFYSPVSLWSLV